MLEHETMLKLRGHGSIQLAWVVRGEKGCVTFLGDVNPNHQESFLFPGLFQPFGVDVHSLTETGGCHNAECCWLDDKEGWCDGSSLAGMDLYKKITNGEIKTDAQLWIFLEQCYRDNFGTDETSGIVKPVEHEG